MSISLQEVEHIAHLARIELTDDQKGRYREQLSAILDHMTQLQGLNTSSTAAPADLAETAAPGNPLRADISRPSLTSDILLMNAAQKERSQFKIPPVFE